MTDSEWLFFGYPTELPCVLCGSRGANQVEPRFGYSICRYHADVAPVDVVRRIRGVGRTIEIGGLPPGSEVRGALYRDRSYYDGPSDILEVGLEGGATIDVSWDGEDPGRPYLVRVYREYYGDWIEYSYQPTSMAVAEEVRRLATKYRRI